MRGMVKFRPNSLRAKILLVVLIVVFLYAGLTALLLANRLKATITAATRESMLNSLRMVEEKVLSELARRAEVTRNLASQIKLMRNESEGSIRARMAYYLATLHERNADKIPRIQAAYVICYKETPPRLICSGQDWTVADLRKRPWWRQALQGEEPVEPLGTSFVESNILIPASFVGNVRPTPGPFTLPIYWVDAEDHTVVGMDFPADLSETPTGSAFPQGDLYGRLYDPSGILLATPSSGGHNPEGYRLFTNDARTHPLLAKAIAEGPGRTADSLVYDDDKGRRVLGIYWRGTMGFIYLREKPLQDVYGPISREVSRVIWLSMTVALAVAMLLTLFLLRDVIHPVHHLAQAMNQLGTGELSTRIAEGRRDEFGQLFKQFNATAEQLQNQIRVAYIERLARRQAELEFLQAQINPHFLYNTLDCIYRLILSGDNKEGGQAIISLSKLFRLSLGRGPSMVTVAEALEQLKHYLELQRLRHGDRITVEVDVSPEILGSQILKLLLQPAVENAFVHGLEPKQGPGKLVITGRREGDTIHFIITDDGIGMSEEESARLHEAMADPNIQTSHGLANVHRRLILAYGDGCGVNIAPRPGGGLQVDIRWPASNREEEEGNPGV
ncbi:MAG: sensor histidine kinase [Firmicutes bacterium]|nr:sensor histidine kinase [Bacillota bacterium]